MKTPHWMKRGSGPDEAGLLTTLSISDAADPVVDSIDSLAPTVTRAHIIPAHQLSLILGSYCEPK